MIQAVQLLCLLALFRYIHRIRRALLHSIGKLIGSDSCRKFRAARMLLSMILVDPIQQVKPRPFLFWRNVLARRSQIQDRVPGCSEDCPLVSRGKESSAPIGRTRKWTSARIVDHYESRKILVLAPKSISHP